MKLRLTRIALVSGLAAAAFVPAMTSTANAFMCSDLTEPACAAYAAACQHVPEGGKYDLHAVLCESFS